MLDETAGSRCPVCRATVLSAENKEVPLFGESLRVIDSYASKFHDPSFNPFVGAENVGAANLVCSRVRATWPGAPLRPIWIEIDHRNPESRRHGPASVHANAILDIRGRAEEAVVSLAAGQHFALRLRSQVC